MSDSIVELEVRVAYQDKLIADLDEVVRGLGAQVVDLQRKIAELTDRVESGGDLPPGPHDEAPPHY